MDIKERIIKLFNLVHLENGYYGYEYIYSIYGLLHEGKESNSSSSIVCRRKKEEKGVRDSCDQLEGN